MIPLTKPFAIGKGIVQIALLQQLHDKPGIQSLEADTIEMYNVFVIAAAQHCNLPLQGLKVPGAGDGTEYFDGNFVHIILDALVHLQACSPLVNTGHACCATLLAAVQANTAQHTLRCTLHWAKTACEQQDDGARGNSPPTSMG